MNKEHRFLVPVSPPYDPQLRSRSPRPSLTATVSLFRHETLEHVFHVAVHQDNHDATYQLLKIFSLPLPTIHAVLLKGITFAGLNYINPFLLHEKTNATILVLSNPTKKKSLREITRSLNLPELQEILIKLGEPVPIQIQEAQRYLQVIGSTFTEGVHLLRQLSWDGYYPTIMRIALRISRPTEIS